MRCALCSDRKDSPDGHVANPMPAVPPYAQAAVRPSHGSVNAVFAVQSAVSVRPGAGPARRSCCSRQTSQAANESVRRSASHPIAAAKTAAFPARGVCRELCGGLRSGGGGAGVLASDECAGRAIRRHRFTIIVCIRERSSGDESCAGKTRRRHLRQRIDAVDG